MEVGDIESVKAKLVTWIQSSRFTDCLDAVNTEKDPSGEGYQTPAPTSIYGYEREVPESYPAIVLRGLGTVYDNSSAAKQATHRIAVLVFQVADTEARVTQDVERLVRALRDLLHRSVLDGSLVLMPILLEAEEYSDLLPADGGNPLMKGALLSIAATTYAN